MDVPVIEMDRQEAKEKLGEYEKLLRGHHMARANSDVARELKAARDGYAAMAAGTPVISLMGAFEYAARDAKGRPNIAVGRSDRKQVCVYRQGWNTIWFSTHSSGQIWGSYQGSLDIQVVTRDGHQLRETGYALVPMVPPLGIHAAGGLTALKDHLTLWEVEEWSDTPIRALPDRDPLLLKPIGGDLYAVMHSWDLTDMERTIMAGRSRVS